MRPSGTLCKGFWGRSLDEFKRLSHIALSFEGIKGPQGPYLLHDFDSADSVAGCKTFSDAEIGGFSESHLTWTPYGVGEYQPPRSAAEASPTSTSTAATALGPAKGYARFHGSISTSLPQHRRNIQRSGYAAWRTLDRMPTIFGRAIWDIDPYAYLAMRIRSDGRAYFVNVQTESIVPTDIHQHRLFARRPGEWETVLIRWNDFVRTNHGFVVEPQTELLRRNVRSVGVGLTDRVPGPFELCIERIWATNSLDEGDVVVEAAAAAGSEGQLRNRHGESVAWNETTEKAAAS